MPICTNRRGDIFEEFIEIFEEDISNIDLDFPLTHALVVAKNDDGFLLMYNNWKKNWEVAGGILENNESLQECALRELLEETNQIPSKIKFRGLMKFHLHNGKTEYGGLFCAYIKEVRPFQSNDEARDIIFWDGQTDIGYIDEIDKKLLSYYQEN